jgi:hypothetical protein
MLAPRKLARLDAVLGTAPPPQKSDEKDEADRGGRTKAGLEGKKSF